jgi:hypothetical protein
MEHRTWNIDMNVNIIFKTRMSECNAGEKFSPAKLLLPLVHHVIPVLGYWHSVIVVSPERYR